MTEPTDNGDPKQRPDAASAGSDRTGTHRTSVAVGGDATGTAKRSGRVSYDARGNPTWEWHLDTGVYSRDVGTHQLKKLDLGDLSIAESAVQKRPPGLGANLPLAKKTLPGGGFNPYDSGGAGAGSTPSAPVRDVTTTRTTTRKPTPPAPRESAWSKLKQLVTGKKENDDE